MAKMDSTGSQPESVLAEDGASPKSARAWAAPIESERSTPPSYQLEGGTSGQRTNMRPFGKRLRALLMIGGIIAVAVIAGLLWWRGGRFVSTDEHTSMLPS
jgi:hypothetical protein